MQRQPEVKTFADNQDDGISVILNHKIISHKDGWKLLCFATKEDANLKLATIQSVLKSTHPDITERVKVVNTPEFPDSPYGFGLITSEYEDLLKAKRKILREKARVIKPTSDFYFKMLRADIENYYNYYFPFVNELIDSDKNRFPKRAGAKGNFTVTGEGVFSRKKYFSHLAPLKKNQYSENEKQGFTNFQSATLGMPDYFPIPCAFNNKKEVLAGIMLDEKDVLLSDRLFVNDAETYERPYDFAYVESAQEYYNKNKNNLFSKKNLPDFKKAIRKKQNVNSHNESLIRMRLNCIDRSFKASIIADNLESRLQAKQYAISLETKLKQLKLCPENYTVPVVYYTPNDPQLLFKEYTDEEYLLDCHAAASIYADEAIRIKKYQEERFEFLMGLSPEILTEALKGKISPQEKDTLALTLLKRGKIFIFRVLQEKTLSSFDEIIGAAIDSASEDEKLSIFNHALLADNEELAEYIYGKLNLDIIQKGTKRFSDSLLCALKKKNHRWFNNLLACNKIDFNTVIDSNGDTFLHIAACEKNPGYVKSLLKLVNNIDVQNNVGNTPLMLAAENGHSKTLQALLANETAPNVNQRNYHGDTALIYASDNGKSKAVAVLKNNKKTNIVLKNKGGWSALYFAIWNRDHKSAELLLENPFTGDAHLTSLYLTSSLKTRCLIFSAIHGDTAAVKWLLDNFSDLDTNNKIVKSLLKANKVMKNAENDDHHFQHQSIANKIAYYFDIYSHPPLFSLSYHHNRKLAKEMAIHLRSHPTWSFQECMNYIDGKIKTIKDTGTLRGIVYQLKHLDLQETNFSVMAPSLSAN